MIGLYVAQWPGKQSRTPGLGASSLLGPSTSLLWWAGPRTPATIINIFIATQFNYLLPLRSSLFTLSIMFILSSGFWFYSHGVGKQFRISDLLRRRCCAERENIFRSREYFRVCQTFWQQVQAAQPRRGRSWRWWLQTGRLEFLKFDIDTEDAPKS